MCFSTVFDYINILTVLNCLPIYCLYTCYSAVGKLEVNHVKSNYMIPDVLKYHVISGTVYSVGLSNEAVSTLSGQSISVQIGAGKYYYNVIFLSMTYCYPFLSSSVSFHEVARIISVVLFRSLWCLR